MRWTVVWEAEALGKLADLWVESADRASFSAASNSLDDFLRRQPEQGAAFDNMLYLRREPLEIWYTISPMDCKVCVIDVRLTGK